MNKVDVEKEIKKYKSFIILSTLGLIFSVVFIVYFFIHNDNRLYGFGAILILIFMSFEEILIDIGKQRRT